jgi:hypothetical protein
MRPLAYLRALANYSTFYTRTAVYGYVCLEYCVFQTNIFADCAAIANDIITGETRIVRDRAVFAPKKSAAFYFGYIALPQERYAAVTFQQLHIAGVVRINIAYITPIVI